LTCKRFRDYFYILDNFVVESCSLFRGFPLNHLWYMPPPPLHTHTHTHTHTHIHTHTHTHTHMHNIYYITLRSTFWVIFTCILIYFLSNDLTQCAGWMILTEFLSTTEHNFRLLLHFVLFKHYRVVPHCVSSYIPYTLPVHRRFEHF
jgi:hypothetical protein